MLTPLAHLPSNARRLAIAGALALSLAAAPASAAAAQWTGSVQAEDQFRYIMFSAADGSSTMNATTDDYRRAQALRAPGQALLYFRQDGAAYVIRDPAFLRQADALFEPQRVLGRRQGELGRQQGELGRRQGALGREQGRLGALQANARPREAAELGRQQGELGRRQGELGAQQGELGRRQGELGRQQAIAGRAATARLRVLVAEAIQRGLAQRVN